MTRHDHDPDLILALAAGSLDRATAQSMRDEIAGCSECSADLAAQRAAVAFLSDAPPVAMTEMEAARFRRDLDTALGHERTVVEAAPTRRRVSWAPVFSVAAILVALVLVAPALQLLGGGGDDDGADAVAFDTADTEASAEEMEEVAADSGGAVQESPAEAPAGDGGDPGLELVSSAELGDPEVVALLATLNADLGERSGAVDDAESEDEWDASAAEDLVLDFEPSDLDDRRCISAGAVRFDLDVATATVAGTLRTLDGRELIVTQYLDGPSTVLVAHDLDCGFVARSP